jgi:DNA-binding MarR family transcriptional regulator
LAARLGIGAAALSRHVAELEAAGYVVRRPHPGDARALLISLSEQGSAHLRAETGRRSGVLQEVLAGWTDEEARAAADVVQRLSASLARSLAALKPGVPQPAAARA